MRIALFTIFFIISNVNGQTLNSFYSENPLNFNYDSLTNSLPNEIKILALGESTHGSHEIVNLKSELLKSLVLNGYKNIILESNFSTTVLLDKYIKNETDEELKTIMKNIGFFPYFDSNFIDLIKWLKKYNSQKNKNEIVSIYGMDIQFEIGQAIKLREKLFDSIESIILIKIEEILRNKCSSNEKIHLLKKISLKNLNVINPANCIDSLIFLNVLESHIRLLHPKGKQYKQREEMMYNNIERIINLFIPVSEKVIIWSHNGHLARHSNVRKITGEYLFEKYRNKYYSIGIDINKGKIKAINKDSIINKIFLSSFELDTNIKTISKEFELINKGILYLYNLNSEQFLKSKNNMREIGGTYSKNSAQMNPYFYYINSRIYKRFDALFLINSSTPLNLENFGYR